MDGCSGDGSVTVIATSAGGIFGSSTIRDSMCTKGVWASLRRRQVGGQTMQTIKDQLT